ncbi:vacuolar iron transporter homolog 4-like [Salvia splendens]|uniref:vacuolar iron transporter homolog 4-like n=1 Tax=Salvia splendens TaxID=180675 RepID=UPI001C27A33B|nr:vacuolar iron transporter homolog 4-like [Salvia splendens]
MANIPNHLQILYLRQKAMTNLPQTKQETDYAARSHWLRAATLGANDGLVSISSLMMGIGATRAGSKATILTGFAALFAGACSMAAAEFVSIHSIETARTKSERRRRSIPNPLLAAMASALAFLLGGIVPLLAAAFVDDSRVGAGAVAAAGTLGMAAFGGVRAALGGTGVVGGCGRVVVGGWVAMGITFGLTKLIGDSGFGGVVNSVE